MKYMLLEDDSTIALALKIYFSKRGIELKHFSTLEEAYRVELDDFDLIILDSQLPDGSGLDFLKWVKESYTVPSLMLTVKSREEEILKGFSYGADEYITKPFSLKILEARINNILRRNKEENLQFKDLALEPSLFSAKIKGEIIDLNRQEYMLLELFLRNKGITLPREKILDRVWQENPCGVNDNTLSVTVKRLREKLGEYGAFIKTFRGLGYRWEE